MEELHNAIADARYMGERNNNGLEPIKPLIWPSQEEVDEFKDELLSEDPSAFSFMEVTSYPVGVYLFAKFVTRTSNEMPKESLASNPAFAKTDQILAFLDDVEEFKSIMSGKAKVRMAIEIWNHLLARSDSQKIEHKGQMSMKLKTGAIIEKTDEDAAANEETDKKDAKTKDPVKITGSDHEKDVKDAPDDRSSDGEPPEYHPPTSQQYELKKARNSVLYTNAMYNMDKVPSERRQSRNGSCFVDTPLIKTKLLSDNELKNHAKNAEKCENGIGFSIPGMEKIGDILKKEQDVILQQEMARSKGSLNEKKHTEHGPPPSNITAVLDDVQSVCIMLLQEFEQEFITSPEGVKYIQVRILGQKNVGIENFASFRILGKGGFGAVYAQKRVETGKLYAVKAMGKCRVKYKGSEDLCFNEREALAVMSSPFVVSLKYAFQTEDTLFIVLDLLGGGDLCYHLNKVKGNRFPHSQARFHAAEILLGLEHIHQMGYVYRDLKPENVLLDHSGHAKISDLGLAVKITPKLVGTAGTLGYMAPEMFRKDSKGRYDPKGTRKPYGKSVDWWAFGCMIMEMVVGKCPFRTRLAKEFYTKEFNMKPPNGNSDSYRAATCRMEVDYTSSTLQSEEGLQCADLCRGLLNRDVSQRLGCSEDLMADLKYHPWFRPINWGLMNSKGCSPPYLPSKNDLNAEDITAIGEQDSMKTDVVLTQKDQDQWSEWDFVSENAFQNEMVEFIQWEDENGPIKTSKSGFCSVQ